MPDLIPPNFSTSESSEEFWVAAKEHFAAIFPNKVRGKVAEEEFWAWMEKLKPLFQMGFQLGWEYRKVREKDEISQEHALILTMYQLLKELQPYAQAEMDRCATGPGHQVFKDEDRLTMRKLRETFEVFEKLRGLTPTSASESGQSACDAKDARDK